MRLLLLVDRTCAEHGRIFLKLIGRSRCRVHMLMIQVLRQRLGRKLLLSDGLGLVVRGRVVREGRLLSHHLLIVVRRLTIGWFLFV